MMFKHDFKDLAFTSTDDGRGDSQWGWYDYIRKQFNGLTVLDVGTGVSKIKERLPECDVTTHEASINIPADLHGDLGAIEDNSYDCVTCFDVIEHVVDYGILAWNMARITRRYLFLTTPGVEVTENNTKYHFHEFHPWELIQLFEATGMKTIHGWASSWSGPAKYDGDNPLNILTGPVKFTRKEFLTTRYLHPVAILFGH